MLPFLVSAETAEKFKIGDVIFVPSLRSSLEKGQTQFAAKLISGDSSQDISVSLEGLAPGERDIILAGCLINYYAQ
jgi:aconitate hydratase